MENNIRTSSNKVYLVLNTGIDTDLDVIRKALEIYQITYGLRSRLTASELNLMVYYMRYGYSEETKSNYMVDTGITLSGVRVLTTALTKKSYLVKSETGRVVTSLAKDLEKLRVDLMTGAGMNILVRAREED